MERLAAGGGTGPGVNIWLGAFRPRVRSGGEAPLATCRVLRAPVLHPAYIATIGTSSISPLAPVEPDRPTSVTFNGVKATFMVVSASEITTTVPTGAATRTVQG